MKSRNGFSSVTLFIAFTVALALLFGGSLLHFGKAAKIKVDSTIKEAGDEIIATLSIKKKAEESRKVLDQREGMAMENFNVIENNKEALHNQLHTQKQNESLVQVKIRALKVGNEWLTSHDKSEEFIDQYGEERSYESVLTQVQNLVVEIKSLKAFIANIQRANASMKRKIQNDEKVNAKFLADIRAKRNELRLQEIELEQHHTLDMMNIDVGEIDIDTSAVIFDSLQEDLKRARNKQRFMERNGAVSERGYLEETNDQGRLDSVLEFAASLELPPEAEATDPPPVPNEE